MAMIYFFTLKIVPFTLISGGSFTLVSLILIII